MKIEKSISWIPFLVFSYDPSIFSIQLHFIRTRTETINLVSFESQISFHV